MRRGDCLAGRAASQPQGRAVRQPPEAGKACRALGSCVQEAWAGGGTVSSQSGASRGHRGEHKQRAAVG